MPAMWRCVMPSCLRSYSWCRLNGVTSSTRRPMALRLTIPDDARTLLPTPVLNVPHHGGRRVGAVRVGRPLTLPEKQLLGLLKD